MNIDIDAIAKRVADDAIAKLEEKPMVKVVQANINISSKVTARILKEYHAELMTMLEQSSPQ